MKPLFARVFAIAVAFMILGTPFAGAQEAGKQADFEVASIRLNTSGGNGQQLRLPNRLVLRNIPLDQLIAMAYKLRDEQILGGPAWVRADRYDVLATGTEMTGDRTLVMLRGLLENRFQLKEHSEIKDGPVYVLTVAKGGVKMPQEKPGSCIDVEKPHAATGPDGKPLHYCDWWDVRVNGLLNGARTGRLIGTGISLSGGPGPAADNLAGQLSEILGRTVIDRTALTGTFGVHLEWTPDEGAAGPGGMEDRGNAALSEDAGPSIFTALREQLGLELKSGKGPVTVLVIDSVERPSEN
jgi:uncharacterized protein (TIGR03435 family)